MKHDVVAVLVIIMGFYILIYRTQWSFKAIEQQNKIFGFSFGKKDIKATSFVGLLVGLAFIVIGALTLFGIIEPEW